MRSAERARGAETKTPASSAGAIMLWNQAAGPLPVLICRPGRTYPHDEHAVCERFAAPQFGQSVVCADLIA